MHSGFTKYKNINFDYNRELSVVNFSLSKNNIRNEVNYINSVLIFLECIELTSPRFIVFDNRNSFFNPSNKLLEFQEKIILDNLIKIGAKKLFILIDEKFERPETGLTDLIEFRYSFQDILSDIIKLDERILS